MRPNTSRFAALVLVVATCSVLVVASARAADPDELEAAAAPPHESLAVPNTPPSAALAEQPALLGQDAGAPSTVGAEAPTSTSLPVPTLSPLPVASDPPAPKVRFVSKDDAPFRLYVRTERGFEALCTAPCAFDALPLPATFAVASPRAPAQEAKVVAKDLWLAPGDAVMAYRRDRQRVRRYGAGVFAVGLLGLLSTFIAIKQLDSSATLGLFVTDAVVMGVGGVLAVLPDRLRIRIRAGCVR